ncbi:MAG: protoporphyrinogen oxidase [Dysgonomonas sp.]
MKEFVVIGAGLTGMTLSFLLKKNGKDVLLLEKTDRVGGAIQTHIDNGFVYEEGPNTGVVSNPEVAELFEMLNLNIETANPNAEKRLILKNNKWRALPSGAFSFIKTPLFTPKDKVRIFFEPLRKKGDDPDESVASLASRRIGKSFVDYAVNPFISGIYAGDPERLVTKYALPKLYNLEQQYGSFIGGSLKKSREKKTERDRKASKKVFSVYNGLGSLINSLKEHIGNDNILCNAENVQAIKLDNGFQLEFMTGDKKHVIETQHVITTVGAYELPRILPFLPSSDMDVLTDLNYAKVIQVAVGLNDGVLNQTYKSFGGLIPKKENKKLLGVLFPSFCFNNRSPQECSTLAIYLGGIRHPELFALSDEEIHNLVLEELKNLFGIESRDVAFMKIFRHEHAIPQYEKSSGKRFETIKRLEKEYPNLTIAGNIRDGIGMADRIKQAFTVCKELS